MRYSGFRLSAVTAALLALACCARAENLPAPFEQFEKEFVTTAGSQWKIDEGVSSKVLCAPAGAAWDLSPFKALSVEARLAKSGFASARLRWVVESRLGGYYCSATAQKIEASNTKVQVCLDPAESELIPAGHLRPWDKTAAANVIRIELRAECSFGGKEAECRVMLASPGIESGHRSKAARRLLDVALSPAPNFYSAKAMLSFRIEPPPADPYSVDGEGDVRVVLPDGNEVLAFFDQDFTKAEDGSAERDVAIGHPHWRAFLRDIPSTPLKIQCGDVSWKVPSEFNGLATCPDIARRTAERCQIPLEVALNSKERFSAAVPAGYVMTAEGAWQASGDPTAGVTMMWRPVPFWNSGWGGFSDMLRPNGALAQQLDALLSQAATVGKIQPLVILDGEGLQCNGIFNWDGHPLAKKLAGSGELYRSDLGRDFSRRWMRYCVARWSLAKGVSGLWITTAVNSPGSKEFHDLLGDALKNWTRSLSIPVVSIDPQACTPKLAAKITTTVHQEFTADPNKYQERAPLSTFGWKVEVNCNATGARRENGGICGGPCFELRANDPAATSIGIINTLDIPAVQWMSTPTDDFFGADTILFDLWVPPEAPHDMRVGMHVRNRDNLWYETVLPGMIRPGDWNTFALDITGANTHGLKPLNHKKEWTDYSRQRIREFGIDIFSTHPNWTPHGKQPLPLTARFVNIRAVRFAPETTPGPVNITLLPEMPEKCSVGALWQCNVQLNKTFANPFDPEQCDLSAIITTPSGKEVRIPSFFNELCERREKAPGGDEIVEPVGSEFFTVRYRPLEAGAYKVRFELREGGKYQSDANYTLYEKVRFVPGAVTAILKLPEPTFTATPGEARTHAFHGFVRTAQNKRNLQFDDGTFFYPIGACLRSPSDWLIPYNDEKWTKEESDRVARRGSYQYDDYFKAFENAGMTWTRVWMCPYWCVLEWRRDWPGYQGLGRYSLTNAWRMDHLLDEAEKRGVYISLCLNNHGQYSAQTDSEWAHNPLSTRFGGPVPRAEDFYSNRDAKIAHFNQLRYVVARWGHSPAVMTWSLLSEVEWTAAYKPAQKWNDQPDDPVPVIDAWHADMSNYLKSIDPNKHMVATHFSHPWRGIGTLAIPELDIASSNAYSSMEELHMRAYDASSTLAAYWEGNGSWFHGFKQYNKPALVEEQGRHWDGGQALKDYGIVQTKRQLDADLHAGVWGSMVQPLAGSTGYWWWMHLHFDNRYNDYKALANFMAGEDFRAAPDEQLLEPVFRQLQSASGQLLGRALKSDRRMYAWIYHENTPMGVDVPVISDGKMRVGGLIPGKYELEFWDTYKGEKISSSEVEIKSAEGKSPPVEIQLPRVDRDIAMKLKMQN